MKPEALVARVLGVPEGDVSEQTSNQNLPAWDSMGHVTLILELESTYGISLSMEDALQLTSIDAIKRLLRARGIAS